MARRNTSRSFNGDVVAGSPRESALRWLAAEQNTPPTGRSNGRGDLSGSDDSPRDRWSSANGRLASEKVTKDSERVPQGYGNGSDGLRGYDGDDEPLLGKGTGDDEESEGDATVHDEKKRRRNILGALVGLSLTMTGYSIFNDSYMQWIYVRFQMDVLGDNYTLANTSSSTNPCLKGDNNSNPFAAQLDIAQARASNFTSLSMVASLVPAIFVNMLLGAVADKKGRKLLFIVPALGFVIRLSITCAVAYWHMAMNFLYIGLAVEGCTGSLVAEFMAISIYMADNTGKQKSRSFGMVLAQVVINMFFSSTHLAVGYFITEEGYIWPMVTALCIASLGLLWFIFCLNETIPHSDFNNCKERTEAVKNVFSFYFIKSDNPRYRREDFIILGVVFFMFGTCIGAQFMTLFLMDEPLCWGSQKIGYVTTFQGLLQSFTSLIVMPLLQKVTSDEVICVLSLLSGAGSRIMLAMSVHDWMIYVAFAIGMLELMVLPIIRGILSRMVPVERRGSLFASVAVIEVATLAASGVGVNMLYSHTVALWHGLAYSFIGSCVLLSSAIMGVYVIILRRRASKLGTVVVVEEVTTPSPVINPGTRGSINSEDDRLMAC
ncbi:solute carrier family 46 member 3 [Aplysia californica]|uniref:Solute carrier family 46 member 3 n=1 Tax=Aplysia californica TaxID=6500 RepID=A0ABM0JAI8_APLCA|nr:solute carrier family 46 member 3 [Aplysia californica]